MGKGSESPVFTREERQLILVVATAAGTIDRHLETKNKRIESLIQDILSIIEHIRENVVNVENDGKAFELSMNTNDNKVLLNITTDTRNPLLRKFLGEFGARPTGEFLQMSETRYLTGIKLDERNSKRDVEYSVGSYQSIHDFLVKFHKLLQKHKK